MPAGSSAGIGRNFPTTGATVDRAPGICEAIVVTSGATAGISRRTAGTCAGIAGTAQARRSCAGIAARSAVTGERFAGTSGRCAEIAGRSGGTTARSVATGASSVRIDEPCVRDGPAASDQIPAGTGLPEGEISGSPPFLAVSRRLAWMR